MAVALIVTVEVDPEAWELTYGDYSDEDILEYVKNQIQGSAAVEEKCMTADVNVRFRRRSKDECSGHCYALTESGAGHISPDCPKHGLRADV